MSDVVRAALVQTAWTGDKASMIERHEHHARAAASQGAQVICFQELFYGPYFCQVQDATYYDYAEAVPEGPTTQRFMALAAELEHGHDPAGLRDGTRGRALQHRRRHRRRRDVPRQVPQDAHPAGQRLLGEVLLPPGQPRLPDLRHRGRTDRRLHLLRPTLPGGWRALGPRRREDRLQSLGDEPGTLGLPVATRTAGVGRRERVLRRRDQPRGRRGPRHERLLRPELLRQSRADSSSGRWRARPTRSWSCATSTWTS